LENTFGVIARNVLLCLGFTALCSGLPTLVGLYFSPGFYVFSWMVTSGQFPVPLQTTHNSWTAVGIWLVASVLWAIQQAALVRVSIEDLSGKKPSFVGCMSTARAVMLPVVGISFLTWLGASLAMILLIVPGIILLMYWFVSIPVQVQERLGVLASMSRSGILTKGSRWAIFGLSVMLAIVGLAFQLVVFLFAFVVALISLPLGVIVYIIFLTVASAAWAVACAVSYVELRSVKEGVTIEELAEAFS
jgi:hypothetical protein